MTDYSSLIGRFSKMHIAIIGDLMLDVFDYGHVERESPEAPVPIICVDRRLVMPGGAGNVAMNLHALGAQVSLVGTVGDDGVGTELRTLLRSADIDVSGVQTINGHPTSEKHRVLQDGRHLLRVDYEKTESAGAEVERALVAATEISLGACDAVIVADYAKGTITEAVAQSVQKLAKARGIPLIVDTKPVNAPLFKEQMLVTPNAKEAYEIAKTTDLAEAGKILTKLFASPVLITQGKDGMTLFSSGKSVHAPALARVAADVSGAGDTVTAVCTLALAAGMSLEETMTMASHGAALAVEKRATGVITAAELLERVSA
jgi:rfaE bifunctional protein kinase chain/domain